MATPKDARLEEAVAAVVLSGLGTLATWLGPLFVLFAPFDYLVSPPEARLQLAVLDLVLGGLFIGCAVLVRTGRIAVRHAHLAAGLIVLSVLPYTSANLWLTGEPVFSGGFVLWVVGIALVLLSWRWLIALLLVGNATWIAIVTRLPPDPDWTQYGFILATATALSVAALSSRLRSISGLEAHRLREQDRRQELERAQAAAQEAGALRRLSEIKSDFMNHAAHELATPMTPLLLEVGILKQEAAAMTPGQRRSVAAIERNVARLEALVGDLLDSAKLDAGRLVMERKPVDVAALLEGAVEEYRQAATERGIAITLAASRNLVVQGDGRRLHQVLANFLNNAMKFTPRGGTVHVSSAVSPEGIRVEVRDSGQGLLEEDAARLFQPFVQLREPVQGGIRGTGLGLHISRGIVERHGGRIGVRSPGRDQGSTFWFVLPHGPGR